MVSGTPGVVIFRKRLLPYSETFIANQGLALQRYRPCFAGLERHEQGVHYLDESRICLLSDATPSVGLVRLRLKAGLARNHAWLDALRQSSPALVHAHFGNGAADARVIARGLGIPLLITWHGHDISKPLKGKFGRQVRWAIEHADHCIAVSRHIRQRLMAADCPADKITVLPTGVRMPDLAGVTPVPDNGRVLLVGRLVEKKGAALLLSAMSEVQRRVPQAHVRIVGDGPLQPELESRARQLGVTVEFLGRLSPPQVADQMREACVVAAPSVQTPRDVEGLGMVFVEAQALGRPVVGFASGGIPDAVDSPRSGLLVAEGDVPALANALASVLGDPSRAQTMGRAARDYAAAKHDLRYQTQRLECVYDEMIRMDRRAPTAQSNNRSEPPDV